jgi:hypothetical protein
MSTYAPGVSALNHCIEGNYEAARAVIETISVPDLAALRQACTDLDNEVHCLIETAAEKPEVRK